MQRVALVPLRGEDLDQLRDALVRAGLPAADVSAADGGGEGRQFFAGRCAIGRIGFVGLEVFGEDALLRSLIVHQHARRHGYGRALVDGAVAIAAAGGVSRVWALTTTAVPVLLRLDFRIVDRAAAPPVIQATTEFASLCPATAACLLRNT